MTGVQVYLLGEARIHIGARSLPLRPNKRLQLLAYLAYRGTWVNREQLQYLFWSDSPPDVARGNFRQLLFRVRAMELGRELQVEHHRLYWDVTTDVAAFGAALEARSWQDALAHYPGPLLDGLEGDESSEFATWLTLERGRLHERWRQALLSRARVLAAQGGPLEAAPLLTTLLNVDGLDDEALKRYMQTLKQAGEPDQALRAYDSFAKRLRQEFQLNPTAELEQLAQHLRASISQDALGPPIITANLVQAEGVTADSSSQGLVPSLPPFTKSFVGRDRELNEVAARLAKPDCRLLTLVGLGGVGKTSLALRTAQQVASSYQDGVYFVSLGALSASNQIPSAIADTLNLSLQAQDEPLSQIVRSIGARDVLIVLDNYEHVLDGATTTSRLLRDCSGLSILATSRERLNVEEEWLLTVEGLSYPEQETLPVEASRYFDAIDLFVQRARRVRPEFVLTQDEFPQLLRICRLLEGSPLGLELAAVWLRHRPLEEIADEIGSSLDFLVASSRNADARHESMRAVFESSWAYLSVAERAVLKRLSVFSGGFSREAAKQIAGASLPVLAALVDKSLLRLNVQGRYDAHTLVAQYSAEKLAQDAQEQRQTEAKHSDYYLQLLREHASNLHTTRRKTARGVIERDYRNVRQAWAWAVAQTQLGALRQSTFALSDFFEGRRHDGLETFDHAAATLQGRGSAAEHGAALGYVLLGLVNQQQHLGHDPHKVRALSQRAISLLEPLDDDQGLARGLRELAGDEETLGNFVRAHTLLQDALTRARRFGEPRLIGSILVSLARMARETGAFGETRAFMEAALSELSELGNADAQAYLLLIYGAYLVYQDQLGAGEAALGESLRLSDDLGGGQDFRVYIFIDLARAAHKRAAFEEAEGLLKEAYCETKELENTSAEATALYLIGRAKTAQKSLTEAEPYFARSLQIAWDNHQGIIVSAVLIYLAELEAARGQPERATELLTLVAQRETVKRDYDEAQRLRAGLATRLGAEAFAQAQKRGADLELAVLVSSLRTSATRLPELFVRGGPDLSTFKTR